MMALVVLAAGLIGGCVGTPRIPAGQSVRGLGAAHGAAAGDRVLRFATFNTALSRDRPGALRAALESGNDPALRDVAAIIQRVRPDVLLLQEFDARPGGTAAHLLVTHYLEKSQHGGTPITYGYRVSPFVNTGVPTGYDLNGNGRLGDPEDAQGFGRFPGNHGMVLLSRYPISVEQARSFRMLRWADMPGGLMPRAGFGPAAGVQRLSSKTHFDAPVRVGDQTVHVLVSHPTPPVFDGPDERNGKRNYDEIRLWLDYISPGLDRYLVDDAGQRGGLGTGRRFVLMGDLNSDPDDGESVDGAVSQLLEHPRLLAGAGPRVTPSSQGAVEAARVQGGMNLRQHGDPGHDTADFADAAGAGPGNLRTDYVLPSRGLGVTGSGVFWPRSADPWSAWAGVSDHRLVWVDVKVR